MLAIRQDLTHRRRHLEKAFKSVEAFMTVFDTGTELDGKGPDCGQRPPQGLP